MTHISSNIYKQSVLQKQSVVKNNYHQPLVQSGAFIKQPVTVDTVTFTAKSKVNVSKILRQNPELKEIIKKIAAGDVATYALLTNKLDQLNLQDKERRAVVNHFADKLFESAYKEPTMNKAIIIAKGNGSGRVVDKYIGARCVEDKAGWDILPFKKNKAKKEAEQARQVLNLLLSIPDNDLRIKSRKEIKATLIDNIQPNYHYLARTEALNALNRLNMISTKKDLDLFIESVRNYKDHTRKVAIGNLRSVLEKYIQNNIKDLEPVEIRNAMVQSLNALQYVRIQEEVSGSTKRLANKCREAILNSKIIPDEIRKEVVKEVYNV